MQEQAINIFTKQDTDSDIKRLDNQTFRELENGRITGNLSDMLAVGKCKGTTLAFQLSEGYQLIGAAVYDGILYLASLNDAEQLVEIGSFPSPDWENCSGVLENDYKPLHNYTPVNYHLPQYQDDCGNFLGGVPRRPLRIRQEHLGWSCERRIHILPTTSYDGSVDLICLDGENPNVVINSGFRHKDGSCLDRYYNNNDFEGRIHEQFNESGSTVQLDLDSITDQGELKAGNYFFALRYGNSDASKTSFYLLPVAISIGVKGGIDGSGIAISGGDGDDVTNKAIRFVLSQLDRNYQYFELGYVRQFDGSNEAFQLVKRYYLQGSSNMTVTITGRELKEQVALETMLADKGNEKACMAQAIVNNIWYGGNWTGTDYHHPDFCEYAKQVIIGEATSVMGQGSVGGGPDPALNHDLYASADLLTIDQYGGYGAPKRVATQLGYFSGETYVFRLHPVFKDGRVGYGYPMRGGDNLTGTLVNTNELGVYRFSGLWTTSNLTGQLYNPQLVAKLATFDFTAAVPTQYIQDNVKGWVISRAKRKANLVYQSLAMACYNGDIDMTKNSYFIDWEADVKVFAKNKYMPLWNGLSYWFLRKRTGSGKRELRLGFTGSSTWELDPNHLEQSRQEGRYGLLSTDYMIDNQLGKLVGEELYLQPVGTAYDIVWQQGNGPSLSASAKSLPLLEWQGWTYANNVAQRVRLYNIGPWDAAGSGGYVSKVTNGSNPLGDGFYYGQHYRFAGGDSNDDFLVNCPMNLPAYIGVEGWDEAAGGELDGQLVNLLRQPYDQVDIAEWYDSENELYHPIEYIEGLPVGNIEVAGGDNFLQRQHLKHISGSTDWNQFFADQLDDDMDSGRSIEAGWGHMVSFITEQKHNGVLRTEKGINRFYPASDLMDMERFASALDQPESAFYNLGYSEVLGNVTLASWRKGDYYNDRRYLTRIRATQANDAAPIVNNFRRTDAGSVADFDERYGPIMVLETMGSQLISFQHSAINLHPVSERVYAGQGTASGSDVLLGVGEALPETVNRLSEVYGVQQRFAVVKGQMGLYAFDVAGKALVRVGGNGVENLAIAAGCDGLIKEVLDGINSGGVQPWFDGDGLCDVGVHGGYLPEYAEIHFSIFKNNDERHTVVFSEKSNGFMGKRSYVPGIYISTRHRMYSFDQGDGFNGGHLHESSNAYNNFYGNQYDLVLGFAISDAQMFEKEWHSMRINSAPQQDFRRIEWQTQTQLSTLDWATAPIWLRPVYSDHGWRLSMGRDDATKSIMRGSYLYVKLYNDQPLQALITDVMTTFVRTQK